MQLKNTLFTEVLTDGGENSFWISNQRFKNRDQLENMKRFRVTINQLAFGLSLMHTSGKYLITLF